MVLKIGIVGFGNFGKFMAKHLSKKADVIACDIYDCGCDAKKLGVKFGTLDDVLMQKIIILAMPMEKLEKTLNNIKNKLLHGTLVLDVCSLKVFACSLMDELLPKGIDIVGTHPLFGPQSAPNSVEGMKVALCNVRGERLDEVNEFCKSFVLETYMITPDEHDRQMAVSQALTHFIGQVAKKMDMNRIDLSTKTFDDLMDVIEIIKNDTKPLFENMQTMNPYAKKVRNEFVDNSCELNDYLNEFN